MDISEYYEYLNYLEDLGFDKKLVEDFSRIVVKRNNANPYESLEFITDEQVYRANNKVFRRNRDNKEESGIRQ